MSQEIMRRLETSLNTSSGSLSDLMKATEVTMLLIDCSGSMVHPIYDAHGGLLTMTRDGVDNMPKRRIDALREVVANIQSGGHVPMIRFGGPYDAQVCFVDAVPEPDGGTPLHLAIPFAKSYGANRLVVISDGMPDLSQQCFLEAQTFGGRIDVVYIGEGDSTFLDQLAKLTGGQKIQGNAADVKQLTSTVIGFLTGEVEERAPIQGEGFSAEHVDPLDAIEDVEEFDDDDDEEDEDDDDVEEE